MRKVAMIGALLSACGVKQYLPSGPVLSPVERAAFADPEPPSVGYTGEALTGFPVLPLQVWGVQYDLDLVLESTHPRYDMHEYARVQTPLGPVWLCKDAHSATKLQSIVADLPDLPRWVPELPIARKVDPVQVDDRSTEDWLDLRIAYHNLEGEPVEVTYEGRPPRSFQKKRSGNTMGHSAAVAMAVLDIPYRDFGRRASVRIAGEDYEIRRLLGLVPIKVVLVQAQGGLAVGRMRLEPDGRGFAATYRLADQDVRTHWELEHGGSGVVARQIDPFRTLVYRFARREGALELEQMEVHQYGIAQPVVTIALQPALPDMRRPFEGRVVGRFAVDVNDQRGQAVGRWIAWWDGDRAIVQTLPSAPSWVEERPMQTTLSYSDGVAEVAIERIPSGK